MSARQLGSVKALKGKIQNKNLSNQRKAILKQQIQQHGLASGLSSALSSGVTSPKVGKAIKRLAAKKRTNRARKVKRRMMRRRRKFN